MNIIIVCILGMLGGAVAGCFVAMFVWVLVLFGTWEIPDGHTFCMSLRMLGLMGGISGLIFAILKGYR